MTRNVGILMNGAALLRALLLAALTLAMIGCVGGDHIAPYAPAGLDLGPLPNDLRPARNVATLTVNTITGATTYLRSDPAHVTDSGTTVMINVSGGIQWAMYKFGTGGNPLTHLKVFLTEVQGNLHTWILISDYGHHVWAVRGPYHTNADIDLTTTPGAVWTDAAHNMYFAVVAWNGAMVQVTKSEVTVDVGPTYTGDTKAVFDANCISCHASPTGSGGVVLDNYTDAAASASASATAAAGDTMPPPSGGLPAATKTLLQQWATAGAPLGPATRYSTDTGPSIYSAHCVTCHSAYSTYAGVKPDAVVSNTRVQAGTMPPAAGGGPLSAALKTLMQDWINDGWPN